MPKETDLLKKLYPPALELQERGPWQTMYERELFGIEIPDSGDVYFCSIMGSTGQFYGTTYYKGVRAADEFLQIQEFPDDTGPMDIILIPQLMVAFEELKFLQPEDKKRLNKLGYTLRNRSHWPVFEQLIPGHIHCFPGLKELEIFPHLLEQTLNITGRVGREEFAFVERTPSGLSGLVRVPDARFKDGWRDDIGKWQVEEPDMSFPNTDKLVSELEQIPKQELILQADLIIIPSPIADRQPPYFPFSLLLVDKETGFVFSFDLMTPHPSVDEMIAQCGKKLLEALIEHKIHPAEIEVKSEKKMKVFGESLKNSTVKLRYQFRLPALEAATEGMMDFLE